MAARKPGTARTRVMGVAIALGITLLFLGLWLYDSSAFSGPLRGQILFNVLIWVFFFFAICSGLFLTSDAISEEKREGTIGLLFLTDLKGYDVVIGKLVASSLIGFYALLAVLPVLALPILMGGVTGTEFWKSSLALLSTMITSLGAGLLVSVGSKDGQRSMFVTFGLLAVLTIGSLTIDSILQTLEPRTVLPLCSIVSPAYLLSCADAGTGLLYWRAFLANQVVSGVFFLAAMLLAPRWWQERGTSRQEKTEVRKTWRRWFRLAIPARRRAGLLNANPILWLGRLEVWPPRFALAWAALLAVGLALQVYLGDSNDLMGWSFMGGLMLIPLYLMAAQSPRFYIDGRQSGWLELLLSTPITPRQIIQGQWRSWVRRFAPALLAISFLQIILSTTTTYQMWASMTVAMQTSVAATATPPPAGTNAASGTNAGSTNVARRSARPNPSVPPNPVTPQFGLLNWSASTAFALLSATATLFNLAAVVWFGMWTGLRATKTAVASMKTLVLAQVLPAFVFHFVSFLVLPMVMFFSSGGAGLPVQWHFNMVFGAHALLSIAKDVIFILWSRHRLHRDLRLAATGELQSRSRRRRSVAAV